jgi:hypothetical protein
MLKHADLTLLYTGIAPNEPARNGRAPSSAETATESVMKKQWIAGVVVASLVLSRTAWAQDPAPDSAKPRKVDTGKSLSPVLGVIGVVTAGVGLAMMFPYGTEYHILGQSYCVTTGVYSTDVNYGSCYHSAKVVGIGAVVAGSGALMAYLGIRSKKVTVAPAVSQQAVGAVATVRWGK